MQSEPVGSWWERSPGVAVDALLTANDGSGAVAGAGEYFHYSNLGFALLGETVARLRGCPWWEAVAADVLGPLRMTRTTYHPQPPHAEGFSVDHFAGTLTREPHQDTGAMAPAGQVWSTVADLGRWAAFLGAGHPDVLARSTLEKVAAADPWHPSAGVPDEVRELLGLWFWGHSAYELRWNNQTLELRSLAMRGAPEVFELRDGGIVGTAGYHRGETMHVHRRGDGTVSHLECATFVHTRTPYDPDVEIPGGHPG